MNGDLNFTDFQLATEGTTICLQHNVNLGVSVVRSKISEMWSMKHMPTTQNVVSFCCETHGHHK